MVDKIGMDIFGPQAWKLLHYISINYPDYPTLQDKENYKNFMESIQYILPCNICVQHYKENLKEHPLTDTIMSSRDLFIKWVIDIHNNVNKIRNKSILSYDEAIKSIFQDINNTKNIINNILPTKSNMIEHFTNDNITNDNSNNYFYVLCFILIGLLFIAIFYKKK